MRERPFAIRDLPLDGSGPVYGQIYRAIRSAILDGRVSAGTRLPATRALAEELGLSRNTVVAAFEPLRAEGYLHSRVGAGTFVAPQIENGHPREEAGLQGASKQDSRIEVDSLSRFGRALLSTTPRRAFDALATLSGLEFDFRPCVPDLERLPLGEWRRALVRTANYLPSSAFDYGDPAGVLELREAIAGYLGRARGISCRPEEIVLVGGVAQALDLVTRLFIDPEDSVVLEDPHYLGARRVFESAGAKLVGVPVDEEGIRLDALDAQARIDAKIAYLTPSHQFPTGAVMSLARRQELLRWAEEQDVLLLEDDYDSEFRYSGQAIEALKSLDRRGRVLYVGTFSKTLLPSLRVAYLVVPPRWAEIFRAGKWLSDWSSPAFEQHALARFIEDGEFERHVRRARTLYAESRRVLVESIETELAAFAPVCSRNRAGLHLWVRFPGIPAEAVSAIGLAGRARGIGLYPAGPLHLAEPADSAAWIFGFGRLEPDRIRRGVAELRRVLESHAGNGLQGAA